MRQDLLWFEVSASQGCERLVNVIDRTTEDVPSGEFLNLVVSEPKHLVNILQAVGITA